MPPNVPLNHNSLITNKIELIFYFVIPTYNFEPLQALILMHYISTFADCLVDVNQQSQLCQVFNQKQSTATIVFYMLACLQQDTAYIIVGADLSQQKLLTGSDSWHFV